MKSLSSILKEISDRANTLNAKNNLIQKIISMDFWYLKISADTFLNIMIDLKFTKSEAIDYYKILLKDGKKTLYEKNI